MIKRILQLWWLILAWLLAFFGKEFWQFNIMELFASLAIIVGAFFAIRGWRRERRRKKEQRDMRRTLGEFLTEGTQIKSKCFEKNTEAPVEEAEQWNEKVFNYLVAKLGDDYAQRFQSHEGLPPGFTTLNGMQAKVESFIGSRLARLNQFLAELTQPN